MLVVKRIINIPVSSNCFVVYDKSESTNCIIVDPGTKDNKELIAFISEEELSPVYIILTHEHFDHCWGVNDLVSRYHVPVICSALCGECIKYAKRNCSVFYDNKEAFTIDSENISIESLDNALSFLGYEIRFFKTQGHTDASISFVIDDFLFTGDTLIKDEKTVTKLPTGSVERLKETVEEIKKLKGNSLTVCPGHGESFALDEYDLGKC